MPHFNIPLMRKKWAYSAKTGSALVELK
jgi:hypothetical protein